MARELLKELEPMGRKDEAVRKQIEILAHRLGVEAPQPGP